MRAECPAENLGYHVAPLHDLLMNARNRYHQLLADGQAQELARIVTDCGIKACAISSANEAAELSGALGLPLSFHSSADSIGPTPPFDAPFSGMVPKLLYMLRK